MKKKRERDFFSSLRGVPTMNLKGALFLLAALFLVTSASAAPEDLITSDG